MAFKNFKRSIQQNIEREKLQRAADREIERDIREKTKRAEQQERERQNIRLAEERVKLRAQARLRDLRQQLGLASQRTTRTARKVVVKQLARKPTRNLTPRSTRVVRRKSPRRVARRKIPRKRQRSTMLQPERNIFEEIA